MWRDRRSGAHGNRRMWNKGGVRDVESSGKNVLI